MNDPKEEKEKEITLKLSTFFHILFQDDKEQLQEKELHNHLLADLIYQLDRREVYVHVEFPNERNPIPHPIVWRKVAWLPSYEKWLRNKKESEERIKLWEQKRRQIMKLASALQFITGDEEQRCIERSSIWIELNNKRAIDNIFWLCKQMGKDEII